MPDVTPSLAVADSQARLRSNEVEIDVLVSHEFATQSPAADLIWRRLGLNRPETPPRIDRQRPRRVDGRTTDVAVLAFDDRTLLIEDKGVGGHFEPLQVESYEAERSNCPNVWTVLVAPKEFLLANHHDASRFSCAVSLEELAQVLEDAAPSLSARELELSYRHRSLLLRRAAERHRASSNPDEIVAAFGSRYQAFVEQVSAGRLQALRIASKWNRIVGFVPIKRFRFSHQLGSKKTGSGLVDCEVVGVTPEELAAFVEGVPFSARLPDGFYVCRKGRASATFRCEVPYIANEDSPLPAFTEAEPLIAEAVARILSLLDWLEAHGEATVTSPEQAITRHLDAVAVLARRAGRAELVTAMADLAERVKA